MSGLKKPTPVSKLAAPSPVTKPAATTAKSSAAASILKSPSATTTAGLKSPTASAKSVSVDNSDTMSIASTTDSDVSDYSYPGSTDPDFKSLSDADRVNHLLPGSAGNKNVAVCVRLRPLNSMERQTRQIPAWKVQDNIIFQTYLPNASVSNTGPNSSNTGVNSVKPASYMYDYIFTEDRNNEYIYNHIGAPILENTMEGFHGCIFAYGQTSSGKTHTIHGSNTDPGMIPLCVESIFDYIENASDRVFTLRVSYLEIYNEIINDLLDPLNTNLAIREDKKRGIFCERLKEDIVISPDQVFSLLSAGESHRHVGKTNYNEQSSRSHTIFRVTVESMVRSAGKNAPVRTSVLNLVDLAGSENAVKAGSSSRVKETGFINRSLLTLGHVISKLAERTSNSQSVQHIPYRDSKLTRILQNSLSGKACVAVVCNLSPSSGNMDETISTLKFASRAKRIKNSATINEEFDQSALLIQYREEIDRLKSELEAYKNAPQKPIIAEPVSNINGDNPNEEDEINQNALNAQIEQLTRMILSSSQVVEEARESQSDLADSINNPLSALMPSVPAPDVAKNIGSKSGTLRKKTGTLKSPYNRTGTLKRQTSTERPSTITAAVTTVPTATEDSTIPVKSFSTADADNKAATNTETLSPGSMSPDTAIPRIPSSIHSRKNSFSKLLAHSVDLDNLSREELMARCFILERNNNELYNRLEQSEKDIESWQTYYVQVNNKNTAIENRIRLISTTHSEKLTQAIARRTSIKAVPALPTAAPATVKITASGTAPTVPAKSTATATASPAVVNLPSTIQESSNTVDESPRARSNASIVPATVDTVTAAQSQSQSQSTDPNTLADVLAADESMLAEGQKLMDELADLFGQYDSNSLI